MEAADEAGFEFYRQQREQAVESTKKALAEHQRVRREYEDVLGLFSELPKKVHVDTMVPVGKKAFFEGQLVHTNEFLVLLGDGYFVKRTAFQAQKIVERRMTALDRAINDYKRMVDSLEMKKSIVEDEGANDSNILDIREYLDEPLDQTNAEAGTWYEDEEDDSDDSDDIADGWGGLMPSNSVELLRSSGQSINPKLAARLAELEREEREQASDSDDASGADGEPSFEPLPKDAVDVQRETWVNPHRQAQQQESSTVQIKVRHSQAQPARQPTGSDMEMTPGTIPRASHGDGGVRWTDEQESSATLETLPPQHTRRSGILKASASMDAEDVRALQEKETSMTKHAPPAATLKEQTAVRDTVFERSSVMKESVLERATRMPLSKQAIESQIVFREIQSAAAMSHLAASSSVDDAQDDNTNANDYVTPSMDRNVIPTIRTGKIQAPRKKPSKKPSLFLQQFS